MIDSLEPIFPLDASNLQCTMVIDYIKQFEKFCLYLLLECTMVLYCIKQSEKFLLELANQNVSSFSK